MIRLIVELGLTEFSRIHQSSFNMGETLGFRDNLMLKEGFSTFINFPEVNTCWQAFAVGLSSVLSFSFGFRLT